MELHSRKKGALCLITASLLFAMMGVFVRLAGDIPVFEKALFRNIIALAVSFAAMRRQKLTVTIPKGAGRFVLMRSILGTCGLICNFYAIDRINLADASMLNKMSPFYAVLFSVLLLKEKINLKQVGIIAAAFMGSLLIVKPSVGNLLAVPAAVAACGGMAAGGAYACLRGATTNGVEKTVVIFAFSAFSTVVLIPLAAADFVIPNLMQTLYLLLCGVCSAAGQFAITAGYTFAPAREISVFDYSQIVFSAIFGIIIFGQRPDLLSILGYIIVISLSVITFLNDRKIHND